MIVNNKDQAMATLQMHNLNFDFDKALEALNLSEKDKENYFVILSISSISQKAFGEERSTLNARLLSVDINSYQLHLKKYKQIWGEYVIVHDPFKKVEVKETKKVGRKPKVKED